MINESIIEYMSNVNILSKEISEYYNGEKGVRKIIPTSYLLARAANKQLAESITQALIDYKYYETWNGELPEVIGTDTIIKMP